MDPYCQQQRRDLRTSQAMPEVAGGALSKVLKTIDTLRRLVKSKQ